SSSRRGSNRPSGSVSRAEIPTATCLLRPGGARLTAPSPPGDGEARPEVQEGPLRSGKCGAVPRVPRARPRPGADGAGGILVIYAISLTGVLGNTLVAPALPDVARSLSVSPG